MTREDCDASRDDCADLAPNENYTFVVQTVYPFTMELRNLDGDKLWVATGITFDEHGNYSLVANRSETGAVTSSMTKTSDGSSNALITVLLVLVLLWPLACFGLFSWRKHKASRRHNVTVTATHAANAMHSDIHVDEMLQELPPSPEDVANKKPPRVECLDVFRGVTIFTMIFVNLGGGGYWYFTHVAWNGLSVADVVFPFFVWIMGVTMNIGVASHVKKRTPLLNMLLDAVLRSVRLFLLGLLLVNDFRSLHGGRIPGVLQSFAFAYLMVNVAIIAGLACKSSGYLQRAVEGAVMLVVVATNLGIAFGLPVPGCPTGYLNQGGTPASVYETTGSWDPEGALNWLMVSFMAYIGYVLGGWFLNEPGWVRKTGLLLGSGAAMGLTGLVLCGFRINGGFIPINKNLWSLSFVLVVSGLACAVLAATFLLVDKFGIWGGTPLKQNGMNAIALYIGHEMLMNHAPFSWDRDTSSHVENTLSNLGGAVW
ncbi:hypothetical protein DYB36_008796 [Aphanomyces astaci]|nr:hypothetical protein DYB36_008796 [Aphanomyces astaci]